MKRFRFAAVIGSTLALSACAYGEGGTGVFLADCTTAAIQHTDGVDWEQARNVNLRIRQGDFTPGYLGLLMGKAYVLRIENGDDEEHTFRAIDFFRSVAVKQISVNGGRTFETPCVDAITLPPGKTTEVRLVAVRDGSYEFENNSLLMAMALVGSAGGFITIERPRELPVSPLETLKLRKTLPIKQPSMDPSPSPGLFDDQQEEQTPGLFDDQVDETPGPGLFDDPAEPTPDGPPTASLQPAPGDIPAGMFAEPSPDMIDLQDLETAPGPGAGNDLPPEQPIDASPSIPVIRDSGPKLDDSVNGMPDEGMPDEGAADEQTTATADPVVDVPRPTEMPEMKPEAKPEA
ncbi:MAG: hypothetical protein HON02_01900, partial [Rhodospirillaceae bacterium]|nr:hypothetical protein [Rhodospirillaceae bacterium]